MAAYAARVLSWVAAYAAVVGQRGETGAVAAYAVGGISRGWGEEGEERAEVGLTGEKRDAGREVAERKAGGVKRGAGKGAGGYF